jgi:predicted Zn-dependent protease
MRRWLPFFAAPFLLSCVASAPRVGGLDVAAVASSASQVTKSVQESQKEFTVEEEIALGEGMVTGMLGASPLVDNPSMARYVNQVGRWLTVQSERPDLPWRFGVLDNENINAFAAPGGQVLITLGLLKRLNSEAELAGVLAHEIGHVLQKHHLNAWTRERGMDAMKGIGLAVFAQTRAGQSTAGQLARGTGLDQAAAEFVKQGAFVKPLDRSIEYEADRIGLVLMVRSGYDPYAYVSVMQTLQALKASSNSLFALLGKTHPDPEDRIAQMERIIPAIESRATFELGRERFLLAMGRGSELSQARSGGPSKAPPAAKTPRKAPAKAPAKPQG